jgi:hypothetical protein
MLVRKQPMNQLRKLETQTPTRIILNDDSYSDTSDDNSSSFDEVHVSALNEPQNIDFTTNKENSRPKSIKRKTVVQSK